MKRLTASTAAPHSAASLSRSATAEIETRTLTFENGDAVLSGTLYLPAGRADGADGADGGARSPVVVITGAWTSVEEQMPRTYAEQMAARGFAAFTFDFRGWGKSGALPHGARYIESPEAKISDLSAAFAFVARLPEIDPARIHGLGVCASAGYMVDAAAGDPLVSRVGLVAPWLQNRALVEMVYGGAAGVDGLIARSLDAQARGDDIIPAAGPDGAEGVLMPIGGYYYEPARGAIPQYDNRWNNAGWEGWLTYHPAEHGPRLDKPLAIVHSEAAAIPEGVRLFLDGYAGAATLQWLENVTQFDFYDNPDAVHRAADVMAGHFRADL